LQDAQGSLELKLELDVSQLLDEEKLALLSKLGASQLGGCQPLSWGKDREESASCREV